MQNVATNQPNPNNRFLLTRFTQPTLDESDLAQLERTRIERYTILFFFNRIAA